MPLTVNSFPPEFLELFKQARTQEVSIPADGTLPHGKVVHLRQKLYQLRQALLREKHQLSTVAQGVTLSIRNMGDGRAKLIAGPAYESLAQSIRDSIGAPTGASPASPASPSTPQSPTPLYEISTADALKQFLDEE